MTLVAVAHGSRDPRSPATVRALVEELRASSPGTEVREAFLDLSAPSLGQVLTDLHPSRREVVVVPLLLGSAYHARVDLPGLVAEATGRLPGLDVQVSSVLGADPVLEEVALDRLTEVGADLADPELGVVLAAVGSSHAPANAVVHDVARRLQARNSCLVTPAFASATKPDVGAAVARLRARGARRFAVGSWFLAPGLLPDRIRAHVDECAPGSPVAGPLGADGRVADLVLRRYGAARAVAPRTA